MTASLDTSVREAYPGLAGVLERPAGAYPVVYLVTYDLKTPNDTPENYDRIIAAIKAVGAWAHIEKSVWLVESRLSSVQLRDHLFSYLSAGDPLFVVAIHGDWASYNVDPRRVEWLEGRAF